MSIEAVAVKCAAFELNQSSAKSGRAAAVHVDAAHRRVGPVLDARRAHLAAGRDEQLQQRVDAVVQSGRVEGRQQDTARGGARDIEDVAFRTEPRSVERQPAGAQRGGHRGVVLRQPEQHGGVAAAAVIAARATDRCELRS